MRSVHPALARRLGLTAAHHAHGEDGVVRDLWVGVVRELAERVQDVESGIGNGDERQR